MALNWPEISLYLVFVLWVVGIACAATVLSQRRSLGSLLLVASALVPVLGSLLAIGMLVRATPVDSH